ncbi:hypothetical protein MCOR25_006637 [Pyricularia grisea]|uniref:Major facilitator superfamily (MFS) profile domain-containing protein n=1 Tax=Pyricularia grisea TaxID=148305 RepID=A0A6P8B0C9_PYRGI|nr:uncharacterized protein PgNI_07798 [Pyricularia grisea]KAI6360750.1 hypothetical protein MCOR25_006637 [Pyricularia grisea]TLD08178.1 hypothetical protein PgNI_07798 [Pyricularia grisea]
MLVVYAITDSPQVQNDWRSPQILVTFTLGILFLAVFVYVEGWVAKNPLLPPSLFAVKYIIALFIVIIETNLYTPPLLAASWFAPLAGGGLITALVGSAVVHKIPVALLIILSTLGFLASSLLFVFIPTSGANHWAWIFPAMVGAIIGIDVLWNVSNISITPSVRSDQQGLAGACINVLILLGTSFFLGWAELTVADPADPKSEDSAVRISVLLGVGAAGASLLLAAVGIRIEPARGDLTADEKDKLAGAERWKWRKCFQVGGRSAHFYF